MLTTKAPVHGCAPIVEFVQSEKRTADRHAVLYTLRWPCDEPVATELPTIYLDAQSQAEPQPDTYVAYGAIECLAQPRKEHYLAYRFDKKTLKWSRRPTPIHLSVKQLARGRTLEL